MRWQSYSYSAARFFLQIVVWVLGGAALGHFLAPGIGAGVGSGIGIAVLLILAGREKYRCRRGNVWIRSGRALGLKPVYSGHVPVLPFDGLDEPANALGCEVPTGHLFIADRTERFLIVNRSSAAGDLDIIGTDDHISDPVLIETFVAVYVSGAHLPTLQAEFGLPSSSERSWREREMRTAPSRDAATDPVAASVQYVANSH